jgi:segregation and condensation protein A
MADEILTPVDVLADAAQTPRDEAVDGAQTPEPERLVLIPQPAPPPVPEPRKPAAAVKDDTNTSPFSVTVGQVYDGPMDLLLDLIRRQNLDIYDIPMGIITAQFLEYCHHLKNTDVDAAGEFVYTASLLIHIKSKMLLPRDPLDLAGTADEDPRRELVDRLLEHERFKSAAQMLAQKQQIEDASWTNPGMRDFRGDPGTDQEIAADTTDLVRVFQDILARLRARPVLNVDEESVTVATMIDYVKRRLLMEDKPVSLRRLLHNTHTERALICMFLAMLELVRLQAVLLHQPTLMGDILIKKAEAFDQIFEDQQAARDDWR